MSVVPEAVSSINDTVHFMPCQSRRPCAWRAPSFSYRQRRRAAAMVRTAVFDRARVRARACQPPKWKSPRRSRTHRPGAQMARVCARARDWHILIP